MFLDVLPIIEFVLEDDITHDEAINLLQNEDGLNKSIPATPSAPRWEEEKSLNFQTLKISDNSGMFEEQNDLSSKISNTEDPFTIKMTLDDETFEYAPVVVNRSVLKQMNIADVLITQETRPLKTRYFRNLVSDMHITMCYSCNKVYVLMIANIN